MPCKERFAPSVSKVYIQDTVSVPAASSAPTLENIQGLKRSEHVCVLSNTLANIMMQITRTKMALVRLWSAFSRL